MDRDTTVPKGIKRIEDMGVVTTTTFFSLWAYIWIYIVLLDQQVSVAEAWITLAFFVVLMLFSYWMDRINFNKKKKEGEVAMQKAVDEKKFEFDPIDKLAIEYNAVEIYKELVEEKQGIVVKDDAQTEKRKKMHNLLKHLFGTEDIEEVHFE